jgi:hypothetical protein
MKQSSNNNDKNKKKSQDKTNKSKLRALLFFASKEVTRSYNRWAAAAKKHAL